MLRQGRCTGRRSGRHNSTVQLQDEMRDTGTIAASDAEQQPSAWARPSMKAAGARPARRRASRNPSSSSPGEWTQAATLACLSMMPLRLRCRLAIRTSRRGASTPGLTSSNEERKLSTPDDIRKGNYAMEGRNTCDTTVALPARVMSNWDACGKPISGCGSKPRSPPSVETASAAVPGCAPGLVAARG